MDSYRLVAATSAERVNVVLGIYKHYPGSISSLKQYPGYTSLSRTLPSIVIRYLHSRLSRAWPWSRDRLKENGGDGARSQFWTGDLADAVRRFTHLLYILCIYVFLVILY
jgi:hypothetical protein